MARARWTALAAAACIALQCALAQEGAAPRGVEAADAVPAGEQAVARAEGGAEALVVTEEVSTTMVVEEDGRRTIVRSHSRNGVEDAHDEVVLVRHGDHVHRVHKMSADEEHRAFLTFVLVVAGMFGAQVALYQWKKRHGTSYRAVTLLGLWVIPFVMSAYAHYWRFLFVWILYTAGTGLNIYAVTRPQLKKDVPRRVYSWFLLVHRITHSMGIGGYGILMAELVGIRSLLFLPAWVGGSGLLVLFYGVYFGVLNRDCAEAVTDRVHIRMGYVAHRKRGEDSDSDGTAGSYVPYNLCALCGKELRAMAAESDADDTSTEQLVKLNCNHEYHDFCIRGWVMVGKRDMCPICGEKVAFSDVLGSSPWQKQSVMWASLLDFMRYMVVWNPVILIAIQLVANGFGLTK